MAGALAGEKVRVVRADDHQWSVEVVGDKSVLRRSGQLAFGVDVLWSFADVGVGIFRKLGSLFAFVASLVPIGIILHNATDLGDVLMAMPVLFGFTGVFVLLTVVCEYLVLVLAEVRARPYTLDRTLTRTALLSSPGAQSDTDYAYRERERAAEQLHRSQAITDLAAQGMGEEPG